MKIETLEPVIAPSEPAWVWILFAVAVICIAL